MKTFHTMGLLALSAVAFCGTQTVVPVGSLVKNKSYAAWGCTPALQTNGSVNLTFNAGNWNGTRLKFATAQNWTGYDCLEVDAQNVGNETGNFAVTIEALVSGVQKTRSGYQSMLPGEHFTMAVPINADGTPYGMLFYPTFASVTWAKAPASTTTLGSVTALDFMVSSLQTGTTFKVNYVNLITFSHTMTALVDGYGQRYDIDFAGKTHQDSDFATRNSAEIADLAAHPVPSTSDKWGGYNKITLSATGRFHTQNYNGKWWYVDPDGHPFLSFGVNAVLGDHDTVVTNRTGLFTALPAASTTFGQFYKTFTPADVIYGPTKSGTTFSFYYANLLRKWGTSWQTASLTRAADRIQSWGMNTVGCSSNYLLQKQHRVPYVQHAIVSGSYLKVSPGAAYWGPAPDPFDPNWATAVTATIAKFAPVAAGDPYCIGWTLDNELAMIGTGEENGRYGMAYGVLGCSMTEPAKVVFVNDLVAKYGTIDALNASWGTAFASWDTVKSPLTTGFVTSANRIADFKAFCLKFWRQYYSTVNAKLKAVDPHTLYMGSHLGFLSPEAVQANQENADVLSFNIYETKIDPALYTTLNGLTKPAFISEFSMGAPDRGLYCGGIIQTASQANRAALFTGYVNQIVDSPNLIGCHWHQYMDEPLLGRRLDMENYAFGFVDVCDNPMPEMVAAARSTFGGAYLRRAGF